MSNKDVCKQLGGKSIASNFNGATINAGETKDMSFTVARKYRSDDFNGENLYFICLKGVEFKVTEADAYETIKDATPVEKHMNADTTADTKYFTVQKNFIVGNKATKILCNGVDILSQYNSKTIPGKWYIAYAKMTIANTSDNLISISDKDISLMMHYGNNGADSEIIHLDTDNTLPKFKTLSIKPSQITTFEIPILVSPEGWTRMDIMISDTKFIFARLQSMQIS